MSWDMLKRCMVAQKENPRSWEQDLPDWVDRHGEVWHYPHAEVMIDERPDWAPNLRIWNGTQHHYVLSFRD